MNYSPNQNYPWQNPPNYNYLVEKILEVAADLPDNSEVQELANHFRPSKAVEDWIITQNKELTRIEPLCAWDKKAKDASPEEIHYRMRWHLIEKQIGDCDERFDRFFNN